MLACLEVREAGTTTQVILPQIQRLVVPRAVLNVLLKKSDARPLGKRMLPCAPLLPQHYILRPRPCQAFSTGLKLPRVVQPAHTRSLGGLLSQSPLRHQ